MADGAKINRSASFRSIDRRSADGVSRSMSGGGGGEGAEKFFSHLKRSGAGGRTEIDAMSETSSQQERKFSALLGGPDPHDLLSRGGGGGSGPMNVGKRLYVVGINRLMDKEERLQNVREQVLMREMSEMTQRPAITRKARQRAAKGAMFADCGREWLENKERHLVEAHERVKAAEVVGMQPQPTLDRKSSTIVERLGDYQGPVTGWETHFAKFCAKKTSSTPRDLFQPTINSNAIRADVEKEIGQRLFDESATRDVRRMQLEKSIRDKELIDPNTGRMLFSPQPLECHASRELRSPVRLTDDLLEEGRRIAEKKKELAAKVHASDPNLTFSPCINKQSSLMAQKSTRRTPLHLPRCRTPDPSMSSPQSTANAAAAGEGSTAKKSAGPSVHADPNDFLRRSELSEHLRQQKLAELQRTVDAEQCRECSFQPRINRRSYELWEKQTHHMSGDDLQEEVVGEHPPTEYFNSGASKSQSQFRQPRFAPSTTGSSAGPHPAASPRNPMEVADGTESSGMFGHTSVFKSPSAAQLRTPHAASSQSDKTNFFSAGHQRNEGTPKSLPAVDTYINTFEQQMFQVLDEWRRIENNGS